MLETRMTPISSRTGRSEARTAAARPLTAPRTNLRSQAVPEPSSADAVRRALPSARQSRLARSEMRLMGLATACTGLVCALLLLYLAAYANVTQLGIQQAQARTQLRQNQIRSELLQAERNSLESPQRIVAAATAQGMTPRGATPVDYVTTKQNSVEQNGTGQNGAEIASDWDQGSSVGTTEDSSAAAPFSH